jgi:iron(III) transport system ATP-binding protein
MAGVTLESVTKVFGSLRALDDVSLSIHEGEFLALLGPSGCGKTTLLRLVAGFETPDSGTIRLGNETVAGAGRAVPPEHRRLAMVFQSYALWPHMTVAENVAFSLRVHRIASAEREARVRAALDMVGLSGMAERKPHQLSGGQRQRVALARCLAMRPRVVLLDEPLANLDAHLRDAMQQEFRRFHAQIGATFIYVTHDQAEAMALADRIAVMDRGRLQQLAPPRELYRRPSTDMVARFVGRGVVVPVSVLGADGDDHVRVALNGTTMRVRGKVGPGEDGLLCLRAPDLAIERDGVPGSLRGRVTALSYQGATTMVTLSLTSGGEETQLWVEHAGEPPAVGEVVSIAVRDGWILPKAATS